MVKMRRTRYEILIEMLKLCQTPKRKTEIVYGCNLNFKIYKKPLAWLIKMNWIKEENKLYYTTKLGVEHLKMIVPALILVSDCFV